MGPFLSVLCSYLYVKCTQIFLQKAEACTHVCHDHLNVTLACLYCSGRDNPKMQWFSASAWGNHIHKHSQDDLPLFPDDSAFTHLSPETLPSTSGSTSESLPLNVMLERAKAAKQCLEEENKASTSLKCHVKHRVLSIRVKTKGRVGFQNFSK